MMENIPFHISTRILLYPCHNFAVLTEDETKKALSEKFDGFSDNCISCNMYNAAFYKNKCCYYICQFKTEAYAKSFVDSLSTWKNVFIKPAGICIKC